MKRLASLIAVAAVVAVAGCGSDNKKSDTEGAGTTAPTSTAPTNAPAAGGTGNGGTLHVTADPSGALKFDTDSLNAKAGKVTIVETNPSPVPHGIAVDGNGVDKDGETGGKGSTSTVTVALKPGTYTFYCPVPGHKAGGMKGTLTVK
jgi:plastocyanin